MTRKRPVQRHSRSVVKTKRRSFAPARTSRPNTLKKKTTRSWGLRSKRRSPASYKSKSSGEQTNWLATIVLWLVLGLGGTWFIWNILLWGVVPKLLSPSESQTFAVISSTAGSSVLVVQLEPEIKESSVFILNGEEIVQLPGQYGEYRLSAIYPLLLIDEKDDRYFKGTINRVFGVFVDKELVVAEQLSSEKEILSSQLKSAAWQNLGSNKSLALNLFRTWYVLQYKNTTKPLESVKQVVDEIRSLHGGTFATRDECRVAILNSTKTSGLAGGLADIVEQNGGIVIRLGQYPQELETSKLLYDPTVGDCQPAMEQIKTLSPVPFEVEENASVQGTFRAPLVAIIGKNFE